MKSRPDGVRASAPLGASVLGAVALVSTALIMYEVVLMRRLLVERWHHFGYLVISVALLGFGASGTLLAILERRVRRWPVRTLWLTAVALTLMLTIVPRVATWLPITARFLPGDLWQQVGWWVLYWLLSGVPFLLGATHIGAALLCAGPHVGRVYAVNLFGSAAGAVSGGLLVARVPVEYAYWPAVALGLLGALVLAPTCAGGAARGERGWRAVATLLLAGVVITWEAARPPRPAYDEYKYAARMEELVAQGSAHRLARVADPHGYVEVYESPLFHDLPFLALSTSPPPMLSILINGDPAGSILRISDASEAAVMDRTLMALPYHLLSPQPRVLLLGETGGTNVWLARRRGAAQITVVQSNAALVKLLREPLAEVAGHVFSSADVAVVTADARAYVDPPGSIKRLPFDLIQIVSLEGLGVGAAGMRGLAEDHLATVEGFAACLRALHSGGVVSVCRGVQFPERENIRLLATLAAALESLGVTDPSRHIIQVRDYLGVCTLALRTPLDAKRRDQLRSAIRAFNLTPVWYDRLDPTEVNRPDALPGPPGSGVDWLHHAARELFSPRREDFYRTWLTNVRPVHDDNPFFWDFYKPGAVAVLREAYGDLWLTRAELGRLFLYASLLIGAAGAAVLILLPLALRRGATSEHGRVKTYERENVKTCERRAQRPDEGPAHAKDVITFSRYHIFTLLPPKVATVVYFAALGLAFMGIEMALISRAMRSFGDPVVASAIVIGGLLALSGLGSLRTRADQRATWRPAAIVCVLALFVTALAWTGSPRLCVGYRPTLLGLAAAALAYFMGKPMPTGLATLARGAPHFVPWAWGVNGAASVIGASLALVLAMSSGYRYVLTLAAAFYGLAALAMTLLRRAAAPQRQPTGPREEAYR